VNALPTHTKNAMYRERLQQAVRVLEELRTSHREENFNIGFVARQGLHGVVGCIYGLCGLDPWFQARGLVTDVDNDTVSVSPEEFFGTARPFFRSYYGICGRPVTVGDAIGALNRAIDLFADEPSGRQGAAH
jgi:hypothetical protein